MTIKKGSKPEPEKTMTAEEARYFALAVGEHLSNLQDGSIADFMLLLRWFAYRATPDEAETLYIITEERFACDFEGVALAILAHMQRELDDHRRAAKRGGAR